VHRSGKYCAGDTGGHPSWLRAGFGPPLRFALLGHPVAQSLSPAMHRAALQALGLEGDYVTLDVLPQDLAATVRGLPARGFRGANVTVPHKQAVMAFLDEVMPDARAIGAANTIVVAPGGRLIGHNTDWRGFGDDLVARALDVRGRPVAVVGAGGAARAVVYALGRLGAAAHVFARDRQRAAGLAGLGASIHGLAALADASLMRDLALVVNATSAGMAPEIETTPWPGDVPYPAGVPMYDLITSPSVTRLMRQAEAAGGQAVNGRGMLVRQGAAAFQLWTGRAGPLEAMWHAIGESGR
jgi:shikimate dehydrogenase